MTGVQTCALPIFLVRPIQGREVIAAIFAQSSVTRGSGTYAAEFKLDERTTFLRWVGTMDGHKFETRICIIHTWNRQEGRGRHADEKRGLGSRWFCGWRRFGRRLQNPQEGRVPGERRPKPDDIVGG